MRKPKYVSPSAYNLFHRDRYEYYRNYLADTPMPKMKQTRPMAAGHGFDLRVKEYLGAALGMKFDQSQWEKNIEIEHRAFAREAGDILFDTYKKTGALGNITKWLQRTTEEPVFEATIEATLDGVPVLGKPDLYFKLPCARVIFDWKVSGFCSYASPKKGYLNIFPDMKSHKLSVIKELTEDFIINELNLDDIDTDWATQTGIYAWSLGEEVGSDFICAIDQITKSKKEELRTSIYRSRLSPDFQKTTFDKLKKMWTIIQSGHIFDELPIEESDRICAKLDKASKIYVRPEGSPTKGTEEYRQQQILKHLCHMTNRQMR